MENDQPLVQSVFGPMLIGVFFNAILYGVLLVQTYLYYQNSNKDARWIKYLIFFLLLAETIDTGLDFAVVWEALVQDYGQATIFQKLPTTFSADPLVTSWISTLVQIFQGWRIRELTRSNCILGLVTLAASMSLVAGTTTTVLVSIHPSFSQLQSVEFGFLAWLVASAVCDVIITISLSWFVIRNKNSKLTYTNSILDKIMLLTIQTGLITSVAAVADVLTFTLSQDKTLEFIWAYSISKLYTNSLLSMLNARTEWNRLLHPPSDQTDVHFIDCERSRSSIKDLEMGVRSARTNKATVVQPPF